ncbi:MAG TPA: response regulator [Ramlibacter sp.]|jgi:CheY-like chemotaxis protein
MAMIVLMEDDAATRTLVASVLKKDGHDVLAADNGHDGLALIRSHHPALVISDVQMPRLNGFEVLAALRQDTAIAGTPVILLTSLQERAHIRIGMTSGADDYITKPFRPGELRDAVAAQLNKRQMQASLQALAIGAALVEQRNELARLYETRLAHELSERWPTSAGTSGDERFDSATVLFVDIPQYAEVAHKLSPDELGELVKKLYGSANDTAHLFGARYMQFIGEGLLAVFSGDSDTRTVNHGLRAVRAALGVVESARGIGKYLETAYPTRQLPPFSVHVALNTGPLALTLLQDPLHGGMQKLPVGEVVSATMQLQRKAGELGWPVALSISTLRMITGAVRTGRRALLELPGRAQPLDAIELTGLALPVEDA